MTAQSPWIEVGALARAFERDSHALPVTDRLDGRDIELQFEGLAPVTYRFLPGGRVRYGEGSRLSEATARITSIRPGIYLIDHPNEFNAHGISLVLDFNSGSVVSVEGRLPTEAQALRPMRERFEAGASLSTVSTVVLCGHLGGAAAAVIARSKDLIGLHSRYVYSPHEVYDHIYLNPDCYVWHCIKGVEAGLADVDRCETYRIAEGLYLFLWMEKIVPTLGLVLIDLEQRRTDGKIMGYRDRGFVEVVSFPMGAKIVSMTRLGGLGHVDE